MSEQPGSPFKGKSGIQRILNACGYSLAGLSAALRHEAAFRETARALDLIAEMPAIRSPLAARLAPTSEIGVGTGIEPAPPSEPDRRVSRIRLSSW
jgi:hypothetical protein